MHFNVENKIGAIFKLVVRKASGEIARESEWTHNLVLDAGLARMSVEGWINRCCVGTGNSNPSVGQTQLDSFLASTLTEQALTNGRQTAANPVYWWAQKTWRFGAGVAAGNISEVGLGWSNTNLWNRALIKDINGDPTTITVLSDEYLDVISEVRVYPTQTLSGSFNLLDKLGNIISTHNYIGQPVFPSQASWQAERVVGYHLFFYSGGISGLGLTANPTGEQGGVEYTSLVNTYPTTKSMRSVFTLQLSNLNTTHKTLQFKATIPMASNSNQYSMGGYVFEISPTITKKSSQIMTYTFEIGWGRYEPS